MATIFQERLPIGEKIKDILTTLLYLSFIVLTKDEMGVYYMAVLILLIFIIQAMYKAHMMNLRFSMLHKYMIAWGLFCLASASWAIEPDESIEKTITIFSLFVAMAMLYMCYSYCKTERLLNIIMWGGFILSIYTIVFVGIDQLQLTLQSEGRLGEAEFANINTIGMACSTSVCLAIYFWRIKKNILLPIFSFPCLLVIAGTGSRKAMVMLVLGAIAILLFQKSPKTVSSAKKIMTVMGSIIVSILIFYAVSQSGIFNGTMDRMDGLIASFQGDEIHADSSSKLREIYRNIGWTQLSETPFLGIGISNAAVLAAKYTAHRTYLHCNYAELAADGGLVGLFIYYIPYLYILIVEAKNIKRDTNSIIIIILVLLNLILDYGRVSYYTKDTYFLFMIYTIHIEHLRRQKQFNR
jgi:hypothetical protein